MIYILDIAIKTCCEAVLINFLNSVFAFISINVIN
jgi:hypothetical protein